MPYTFGPALEDDAFEILRLYRSLLGTEGCVWTEDYPSEREIRFDLERDCLFCMRDDGGRIAGVISIDDDPVITALTCWSEALEPAGELARVGVRPDCQGQGLAGKLVLGAMEVLRARGYRGARYLVCKTNGKANRAYAGLGFMTVGETELWGHDYRCCEKAL